jgi:hypothetical protein
MKNEFHRNPLPGRSKNSGNSALVLWVVILMLLVKLATVLFGK